jgi:hypothetical protein
MVEEGLSEMRATRPLYSMPWAFPADVGYVKVSLRESSVKRVANVYGERFPGRGIYLRQSVTNLLLGGKLLDWGGPVFFLPTPPIP